MPGHVRTGGDQRRDRYRNRLHGFDPDGGYHRPGAHACDRPGRLPGVRHGGHHAAVREAQFPGQGRDAARGDDQEGVLSRADGSTWAGAGRHSQGRHPGERRVSLSENRLATLIQPGDQGPLGPDQEGGAASARGEEADDLRRRGRGAQQRLRAADAPHALARVPVHDHVDGARRLPWKRPAVHRPAGDARHVRVEHGHADLRRPDRHRLALRRPSPTCSTRC